MAARQVVLESQKEYHALLTGHKRWYLVPDDFECQLYDTVIFVSDSETEFKNLPIYKTVTHIENLNLLDKILSLK